MFRLDADKRVHFCDGVTRRDFLHAGSLAFLGLSMPEFYRLKALGAVKPDKDVSCIQLMLVGGPSQLDTWDMKPESPASIRGPFKPIKTNVSGIEISEIFPRMAIHADKFALLRSVYHTAAAVHDTGCQMMQTGRLFQGGLESPNYGSVLRFEKGARGDMPPNVLLPYMIGQLGGNLPHGDTAGFLGKGYDPFVLNADPAAPDFKVPDMLPPEYISAVRVDRRRSWRAEVDKSVQYFEETNQDTKLMDATFNQAYTLMTSAKAREAFELNQEPEEVRKRYGMNRFGQGCLLARRLVERGVRFVTLNMFETVFNDITWDIHGSAPFSPISCYSELVGPMFDNAYSSLLEDLSQRGLLDSTLVLATGEFGRTPRINPAGGRDHWPQCWTVVFAGGGIKGGNIVGASDTIGAAPQDRPVTPSHVAATVYKCLGIPVDTILKTPQGRDVRLVDHGFDPIEELLI
ncbi:DUF1501 domain-containing protein [Acidicapsa acidisoli]|uniref:DUF1501 domain-containing protein n=1 Tax=Acidicapsa acidisoli TaxID=1615681 RepID=UPI0021E0CADB|nr:DUF1501 domain-containing protein [Acidicapsa acidisoli]